MTNEELEALEAEAAASELTKEERDAAARDARERTAKETIAANARKRRERAMGAKEAEIQKALGQDAVVKAFDLVAMFPLGSKPAFMPECGYVVLRNPTPKVSKAKDDDAQTGTKTADEIAVEFVTGCVAFPVVGDDGVRLGQFLRTHSEAMTELFHEARTLGGAKRNARPLGRS